MNEVKQKRLYSSARMLEDDLAHIEGRHMEAIHDAAEALRAARALHERLVRAMDSEIGLAIEGKCRHGLDVRHSWRDDAKGLDVIIEFLDGSRLTYNKNKVFSADPDYEPKNPRGVRNPREEYIW